MNLSGQRADAVWWTGAVTLEVRRYPPGRTMPTGHVLFPEFLCHLAECELVERAMVSKLSQTLDPSRRRNGCYRGLETRGKRKRKRRKACRERRESTQRRK